MYLILTVDLKKKKFRRQWNTEENLFLLNNNKQAQMLSHIFNYISFFLLKLPLWLLSTYLFNYFSFKMFLL